MPLWMFLVFGAVFVLVLATIVVGFNFVENQRRRRVAGMVQTVSGAPAAEAPSVILKSLEMGAFTEGVRGLPFNSKWEQMKDSVRYGWNKVTGRY